MSLIAVSCLLSAGAGPGVLVGLGRAFVLIIMQVLGRLLTSYRVLFMVVVVPRVATVLIMVEQVLYLLRATIGPRTPALGPTLTHAYSIISG